MKQDSAMLSCVMMLFRFVYHLGIQQQCADLAHIQKEKGSSK